MSKNETDTMTSALPVPETKISSLAAHGPITATLENKRPWPLKAEDSSPLVWWRKLPPDSIRDPDRELLRTTLRRLGVLHGDNELSAALHGDADAAIGTALAVMPTSAITLQIDIAMSTLLNSALNRHAASALVMAQVVGLTDLGHPFAIPLAACWFDYGLMHSADPDKFGAAKAVLRAAFREHHGDRAIICFDHPLTTKPVA
jgi:hypothetical protein